jgi:CheY-like chemotaxis protein
MAKIMLVEDDNNLREIYEARLLAEGYEIVSAEDGEQALALAVKEKPDLIISDVMMPKISGFDMLDILRSTPETRNTKVIMMTALSQAEDKARASKLGADRYLVKSQVTLEDVAKVAREVLQDEDTVPAANITPSADVAQSGSPPPTPTPDPAQAADPAAAPPAAPDPAVAATPLVAAPPADPVQPADDTQAAGDQGGSPSEPPKVQSSPAPQAAVSPASANLPSQPASVEQADMQKQINDFVKRMPSAEPAPAQRPAPAPLPARAAPVPPAPVSMDVAEEPNVGPVNTAANTAAQMANAANEALQKPAETETSSIRPAVPHSTSQIAGKKVIKPINEINPGGTLDINALLAKEMADSPVSTPAPTQQINPSGTTPAPAAPPAGAHTEEAVEIKTPGNVVTPGNDPNSIAL